MLKKICGLTVENILLRQYRKKPNVDGSYGDDIWSMLAITDCKICHNLVSYHSCEIVDPEGRHVYFTFIYTCFCKSYVAITGLECRTQKRTPRRQYNVRQFES